MKKTIQELELELASLKEELEHTQKTLDKCQSISCFGVEDLPDPVIFYDMNNRPVYCNPFFTDVFGWDLSDFNDPNFNFVPKNKKKEADQLIQRIFQGEIIRSFETSRTAKSGEIIHIRISAATNKNANKEPIGWVVIFRDIRQKKKFKDLLIESEEKYRTLMEAIADPVIVYDMQGQVTYFNPAFSRVFKWSLPECLGKKMDHFVPDENWPETKKMIEMTISGKFFSGVETRRYDKHGNIIPVVISGSTYRDKNNKIIGSIINFQDIGERKKKQKKRLKKKTNLKEFSSWPGLSVMNSASRL